jgi:zinc and cadmium transporter
MSILAYIILFTLLGSIASLIGGALLLLNKKLIQNLSHYLSAYAGGALLGAAFFDLLPEAFSEQDPIQMLQMTLLGILIFFILERFIRWFHHHHEHPNKEDRAVVSLVVIGDSIHNFIDGVAIAGTFLISIPLGIVTTIAVAAHEIPQEIGDFGVMIHRGVSRTKILLLNVLSAFTSLFGALSLYLLRDTISPFLPSFLAITAGFFIYIALSDLIPEIHQQEKRRVATVETIILLVGILTIWVFVTLLEGTH